MGKHLAIVALTWISVYGMFLYEMNTGKPHQFIGTPLHLQNVGIWDVNS